MAARHWKDGQPFYCVTCRARPWEYEVCERADCELESVEDAKRRTGDTHCSVCGTYPVDPEEGETTCPKCLLSGRSLNDAGNKDLSH
jgi:hypothetical protein